MLGKRRTKPERPSKAGAIDGATDGATDDEASAGATGDGDETGDGNSTWWEIA